MSILLGTPISKFYTSFDASTDESRWPVLICLLGGFRLLKAGQPVRLRNANKTRSFLVCLAMEKSYCVSREAILEMLWPNTESALASQSLNSLVHSLRRLLSDTIGGEPPVIHSDDCYRLNIDAGIGVDTDWFEALAFSGEHQERSGNMEAAVNFYRAAVNLYRGDLFSNLDTQSMIVGESLRGKYMTLLSRLADYSYADDDLRICLEYARRLLSLDPCREDAHRVVMRCYARQGERTQALRQYQLCETVLRNEFDILPEAATTNLYNQIRLNPDRLADLSA